MSNQRKRKKARKPVSGSSGNSEQIIERHAAGRKEKDNPRGCGPVRGKRLWMYRFLAIFAALLLVVVLELVLRVCGVGFSPHAFNLVRISGQEVFCDNPHFGELFFPKPLARHMDPFAYPLSKGENTWRIFILGGSAAQGTPDGDYCFGRILQVMLRVAYPQARFEVITAAMPAINSHVALTIAQDCCRLAPDMFIVYMGNNEVVGPYGAGTVFSPIMKSRSLVRAQIALKCTRIGQSITTLGTKLFRRQQGQVWRGLEMFQERQVSIDNPQLPVVYRHFRQNLQDIAAIGGKLHIPVVLCTVGSNLRDCPPFASLHKGELTLREQKQWESIYAKAISLEKARNYAGAIKTYLAAVQIDSKYAELQYRLGRCYEKVQEYNRAREHYLLGRDLDTLRFRADTAINNIIRETAAQGARDGVILVDMEKRLAELSPHGIPGDEFFLEHVHYNFRGNYTLAQTIFEAIQPCLPQSIRREAGPDIQAADRNECARRLAYTEWDRYNILEDMLYGFFKRPPFINQLFNREKTDRLAEQCRRMKKTLTAEFLRQTAARYRMAMEDNPADWWLHWKYAELLMEDAIINPRAAAEQYRWIIKRLPHYAKCYAKLALALGMLNKIDDSIAYFRKSLSLYPYHPDVHFNLGFAYQLKGQYEPAIEQYELALRYNPEYSQAYYNLGASLFKVGRADEALKVYEKGIRVLPEDVNLRYNLAVLLKKMGRPREADEQLRVAHRLEAESAKVTNKTNQ